MSTDAATRASGSNRPIDPRLLRYSSASRHFLLITAAIVLAQTGVIIGFAWLLTTALVGAIAGEPVETLLPALGGAAALALVRGLLIAASERTSAVGAARASLQLRAALVSAVDRLGPAWLSRRNSAALAVTAGHGLEALDAYFGRYLPQLVATAITMPVLIVTILVSDPLSGLIVVLTMPLIPLFMVLIGLATQTVQRRQYGTLQHLASRFADTVAGLGTLKVFGRQHRAARSIETVTGDYKRETMAVLRVSFLSGFALEFLASISVAIIAVEIGFRLLGGQMPLLVGLFVLLLAPEAYLPLRQVGVQFHAAAEGVAATDEIFQTLDDARALTPAASVASGATAPTAGPLLRLDHLRVPRGDREIGPIDLELSSGEVVLLEGPSGAGKSSILAALLGFADYTGRLEVAGTPATDAAARGILAWAGQRPGLVSGSVAENVALGDERPDEALVARCLADAVADVDGALVLGVAGAGLSGGQAQRVAVARALYRVRRRGTPVLALDEPTSALDAHTEAALWQTVRRAADVEGAAVLLVSHRPTARKVADRVITVSSAAALGSAVDAAGEGGTA
ncbi:thiol reductant ABC exporter subunit CydD [Microbacterium sp. SORGH_AS_0862]|uniref:thiol reductant ABC exporter subunit CydD n=1 Tax=Microbacterium sp. SORGH_AS_0862 TaxID=3041789 RepID=UPI00278D3120|nr:thiol reductant ABC exporter subunit CydD [Microbacterium sp. SORGH_AS_0862]MDQ1205969.1 ATP-binding cassette subfamily C protein CydD [Microbacterium sp. SORGH_AS_0862]